MHFLATNYSIVSKVFNGLMQGSGAESKGKFFQVSHLLMQG